MPKLATTTFYNDNDEAETAPTWPWPEKKRNPIVLVYGMLGLHHRQDEVFLFDQVCLIDEIEKCFDVSVTATRPDLRPVLDTLARLSALPENWDSYGAKPIDARLALYSISLLAVLMRKHTPAPSVVPTTRGGIQLEWHMRGIDLEIGIESLSSVHVFYEDARKNVRWEGDLSGAIDTLDQFVAELSSRV